MVAKGFADAKDALEHVDSKEIIKEYPRNTPQKTKVRIYHCKYCEYEAMQVMAVANHVKRDHPEKVPKKEDESLYKEINPEPVKDGLHVEKQTLEFKPIEKEEIQPLPPPVTKSTEKGFLDWCFEGDDTDDED